MGYQIRAETALGLCLKEGATLQHWAQTRVGSRVGQWGSRSQFPEAVMCTGVGEQGQAMQKNGDVA